MPNPDSRADQQDRAADDLQVLISTTITSLLSKLPQVAEYVDTRQHGIGFATPDSLEVMDDQIRAERRDRTAAYEWLKERQLHWNLLHDIPTGTGEHKAPMNLTVWSFLTDVDLVLADEIHRLERSFRQAGICALYRLPAHPSTSQLAGHLRSLTWHVTNVKILDRIHQQLDHLDTRATRILEGHDDRMRMRNAPCPYCGRETLVVYLSGPDAGVVRCEWNSRQGGSCVCPHEDCDCKQNPYHRHEWHRDRGTTRTGWYGLADRLKLTKQIHQ